MLWFWLRLLFRTFVHDEMSVVVGQMPVGHVDEKDRLKEGTLLVWPQNSLGTSGKSYQCDRLAQWEVG